MLENVKDALKKRGMSEKDIEYYKIILKKKNIIHLKMFLSPIPTDAEKGRNNA